MRTVVNDASYKPRELLDGDHRAALDSLVSNRIGSFRFASGAKEQLNLINLDEELGVSWRFSLVIPKL